MREERPAPPQPCRPVRTHTVTATSFFLYFAGRNFYETLRCLDSLQLTLYHQVSTPANWKNGEDCFVLQDLNPATAKYMFPGGFSELRPYYRVVPQPDMEAEGDDL